MCKKDFGFSRKKVTGGGSGGSSVYTAIGAPILKTGQVTPYQTGDDGSLQMGRGTDFFTLPIGLDGNQKLNPFGNSKRFTGTTGGYQASNIYYDKNGVVTTKDLAFPNNIYMDWSTSNENTTKALAYYLLVSPLSHTQPQLVSWATALSVGTYTSGWYPPNLREILNLVWENSNYELNYNPLNITTFSQLTGTTVYWDPNQCKIFIAYSSNPVVAVAKSGARSTWLACRLMTINGTIIT